MRRRTTWASRGVGLLCGLGLTACSPPSSAPLADSAPPAAILLITLDTTRADSLGFESDRVDTPVLDALASRGLRFAQAYTTAPMTLPAHASMFTGLYPADHGIRENGRRVGDGHPLLASRLREQGYTTAAFVSGFPLAGEFGLSSGFDHYDDDFGADGVERIAGRTTDRALSYLRRGPREPLFLWVHYFDPHEPYRPPEPFESRYFKSPYLGEIAYMDRELGRLLAGFEHRFQQRPTRVLVVGDHGEGLGEHGETLHGNLLYQGVMRVPLLVTGTGITAGIRQDPVSVRQVYDTILGWADSGRPAGLMRASSEPVLAEALTPFLQYGWQPQVMAVSGHLKLIRSGDTELYDVRSDPGESRNLIGQTAPERRLLEAVRAYSARMLAAPEPAVAELDQETKERLASLGYVSSGERAKPRENAPNPREMVHLFDDLDRGSALFVSEHYEEAIPVFERILEQDPENLSACLRLAVANSVLDREKQALGYFERARAIDSASADLRHYLAMHYFRSRQWELAAPLFESVLSETPRRLPALAALAQIRKHQGRIDEAARLLERVVELKSSPAVELLSLGELRMAQADTVGAIRAFERARNLQGEAFTHALELGVCYLADRQLAKAAASLDRVAISHPGYPMALFKRAQVSVLLTESDRGERIRRAYRNADPTTRQLIENEPLFEGFELR